MWFLQITNRIPEQYPAGLPERISWKPSYNSKEISVQMIGESSGVIVVFAGVKPYNT